MQRPASLHPDPNAASKWLDGFPIERVTELSHHQRKPNPDVLLEICQREGIEQQDSAYVGDSLAKDVLMAKAAHVFAIWAKYGAKPDPQLYEKLVRVTHWTAEDVRREAELKERALGVRPDFTLEHSFDEVLTAIGIAREPANSDQLESSASE
jgi:beta-phosphoglucomutase-like phosphatase (HAD superfamily)